MAGNVVEAQLSARTETQLPQAEVELVHSRGPLLSEPLPAAAIEWATVLTATALPEGQPYPPLYQALEGLAGCDRGCAVGGRLGRGAGPLRAAAARRARLRPRPRPLRGDRDATTISSRSAPSRAGQSALPKPNLMRASCCPCRAFVREGGRASWPEIAQGLDLTGHFLLRDVLTDRSRADRRSPRQARRTVAPRGRSRLGSCA